MVTQQSLGQAEAALALDAIRAELARRNKTAVIAVGDSHGELIALWRCDGAELPSIQVAISKVWTAARLRQTTGTVGQAARAQGWSFGFYGDPRYLGWEGGAPVVIDGQTVGAVAVSGLAPEEDLELARLAIDRILASRA